MSDDESVGKSGTLTSTDEPSAPPMKSKSENVKIVLPKSVLKNNQIAAPNANPRDRRESIAYVIGGKVHIQIHVQLLCI